MPGTLENGSGESRLDRIEGLMELLIQDHIRFSDEHEQLLPLRFCSRTAAVDDLVRRRPPQ